MPASPSISISAVRRRTPRDCSPRWSRRGARTHDATSPFRLQSVGRDRSHRRKPEALAGHRREFRRLWSPISPAKVSPGRLRLPTGSVIHAAGGSEAQELAFALASAVAYLRALEQGGIALDDARRFIYFRLAADQDQFLTIAKFRALRKLWARIEQACGLEPRPSLRRRRDCLAHDDQARSAWQHRARHHRRARRCGRRRRCRDGAAVQRGARAARRVRTPHRPQHADDSDRRGQYSSRRRSRRGLRRHRSAHRCAVRCRLGPVPGHRARRRARPGA